MSRTWIDGETGQPKTREEYEKEGFTKEGVVLVLDYDKDVMMILHPDGRAFGLRVD